MSREIPGKSEGQTQKIIVLPCGCEYEDLGWMLTRAKECKYHQRRRTAKRPHRPKAECVRP